MNYVSYRIFLKSKEKFGNPEKFHVYRGFGLEKPHLGDAPGWGLIRGGGRTTF